jgi:type II secretory pathway component PulC
MRAALAALLATGLFTAACGAKVATPPLSYDEDFGGRKREPDPMLANAQIAPAQQQQPAVVERERVEAPPGKGLRSGTIDRKRLLAVLDAGPANLLRQIEIMAKLDRERFVGWQLVQLVDRTGPLVDVDLLPGDILLAVNGKPLSRPDQLQAVWDSLRTANEVTAQLWRGDMKLTLTFAIEPRQ